MEHILQSVPRRNQAVRVVAQLELGPAVVDWWWDRTPTSLTERTGSRNEWDEVLNESKFWSKSSG